MAENNGAGAVLHQPAAQENRHNINGHYDLVIFFNFPFLCFYLIYIYFFQLFVCSWVFELQGVGFIEFYYCLKLYFGGFLGLQWHQVSLYS